MYPLDKSRMPILIDIVGIVVVFLERKRADRFVDTKTRISNHMIFLFRSRDRCGAQGLSRWSDTQRVVSLTAPKIFAGVKQGRRSVRVRVPVKGFEQRSVVSDANGNLVGSAKGKGTKLEERGRGKERTAEPGGVIRMVGCFCSVSNSTVCRSPAKTHDTFPAIVNSSVTSVRACKL